MIIAVLYLLGWKVVLGAKAVSLSPKIESVSGLVKITGFSIRISHVVSNGIQPMYDIRFPQKEYPTKDSKV
jgi:hypothetical protein